MYIIGSSISDDEIPKVTDEVKKFIETSGGAVDKHEDLGKKKLAYPIKKTRNGFYVVDQFSIPSEKVFEIEHKVRTHPAIIRYLVANIDDALIRMQKDSALQAKLKINPKEPFEEGASEKPAPRRPVQGPEKKIKIDLDAEIEKALESEDLK